MVWEEKRRSTSLLNGEHFSLSVYDYCVLHCTSTNYIVLINDLCWCIYNVYNQSIFSCFQYKISPFSQVNVLYNDKKVKKNVKDIVKDIFDIYVTEYVVRDSSVV